ncbi:MAG: hypothetical protein ABW149_01700 [Sedimenticola sp.]
MCFIASMYCLLLPIRSYAETYDEEHIEEMCQRLNGQFQTAMTLSNLGIKKMPIDVFKIMEQDLDDLMLDHYDFPKRAINSSMQLDHALRNEGNILIVVFDEMSSSSRILLGHTLNNPEVNKSLKNITIIYANLTYSRDKETQSSREELMKELKVFPPALIYSRKTEDGKRINNRGFISECVKPSQLVTWLTENASNK